MGKRRTFYKTSAAARAANRHGHTPDGRVLLSTKQWTCAAQAMETLAKRQRGNGLAYTTAMEIARVCGVSNGVARRALHGMYEMGLLRMRLSSGSRPEMFLPRAWP